MGSSVVATDRSFAATAVVIGSSVVATDRPFAATAHQLLLLPTEKKSYRYKRLVDARVAGKRNNMPQHNHNDSHFCTDQSYYS